MIRVERGWDSAEGEIAPKSRQGRRRVPIPAALRDHLDAYLVDAPASGRIFTGVRDSYDRGRAAAVAAGVEPATLPVSARVRVADDRLGVNIKAIGPSWATPTRLNGHA